MPRRTKENAEQTRLALMEHALFLFAEQGVSGTSISQIVKAAGVTKGAFYWHFTNRASLFDAMDEHYVRELEGSQPTTPDSDPLQALLDGIEAFCSALVASPEARALLLIQMYKSEYTGEMAPILASWLERDKQYHSEIEELLFACAPDRWNNDTPGDCNEIAHAILDQLQGLFYRSMPQDKPRSDLPQLAVERVKLLLIGVGLRIQ